jgi:hypothetical protein
MIITATSADEQEDPGEEGRQPGPGTGRLHVDHRLTDHRAAAHAAEEAGDDVGDPLTPGLARLGGVRVGDLVDELGGHQ